MTSPLHRCEWLDGLIRAACGKGGARLAVIGQSNGDRPYWAGLRFPPVRTLLEAVLRCLLAAPYDRIVVFSGVQRDRLPKAWQLGARFFVGTEPAIWVARGAGRDAGPSVAPKNPWETTDLGQPTAHQERMLLWQGGGRSFQDRLEQYGRQVREEIAAAQREKRRTALVVEAGFFLPSQGDWDQLLRGSRLEERQADSAERALADPMNEGTPLDLILISEEAVDEHLVTAEGRFLEARRPRTGSESPPGLPRLTLGRGFQVVRAQRQAVPFPGGFVEISLPPESGLYRGLRTARIDRRPSRPEVPEHPERVALEFWANLDLERPRRSLEEEIIGQGQVKEGILSALERLKTRCRDFLDRNPNGEKTAAHPNFLPPVFGLFGAAGMGKTTFCKVLGSHLLGDESFVESFDLAGKDLGGQTIGVAPPGLGADQMPPLVRYAQRTGGLGLACFDEFSRVQLLNTSLAVALGPLLQILQDRSFVPANESFRPAHGGRYHLVNSIFVFAGNIAPADGERPSGFTRLDELGPAFSQRVTQIFYFDPLQEDDFVRAAEVSLRLAAREFAIDFELPDRVEMAQNATVAAALRKAVLDRFRNRVGGAEPSLRALRKVVEELDFRPAFDTLRRNGGDRLVLDVDVLGGGAR